MSPSVAALVEVTSRCRTPRSREGAKTPPRKGEAMSHANVGGTADALLSTSSVPTADIRHSWGQFVLSSVLVVVVFAL